MLRINIKNSNDPSVLHQGDDNLTPGAGIARYVARKSLDIGYYYCSLTRSCRKADTAAFKYLAGHRSLIRTYMQLVQPSHKVEAGPRMVPKLGMKEGCYGGHTCHKIRRFFPYQGLELDVQPFIGCRAFWINHELAGSGACQVAAPAVQATEVGYIGVAHSGEGSHRYG